MPASEKRNTWAFVAHTVFHLERLKVGAESWWCVDRACQAGDEAFIYRPLIGVFLHFEILELLKKTESFCDAYQMATARIRALNVFEPPISSKMLKSSPTLRNEQFVRRNFQGKAFRLGSENAAAEIIALSNISKLV